MIPFRRQIILLVATLCLAACHNDTKNEIRIINKNGDELIDERQNLIFAFNKDIYPDSLLQQWDSTDYITFAPAVQGAFKWTSSSELMFSPGTGFRPGTEYTATINKKVLDKATNKAWYLARKSTYHFHTAPLQVANTHLSWTRGKSGANVMVQLDVDFNYEIKIAEAAAKVKILWKGAPVMANVVNNGTGKTVSVQFFPVNDVDQETPVTVKVANGIALKDGSYVSGKDTMIETSIPSRYVLGVTDIQAQHTGTEGIVTVNTSQPIMDAQLKDMVSLEPAVPFEVTATDAGFVINSTEMKADQTYQLNISAKLEGMFGGKMKSDYSQPVTFGKLEPAITFGNSKGMYLSSQGAKNVAINIVNVPKIKVTMIKVYENNLEAFMRNGKRDGYDYEDDYAGGGDYEYYNTENMGDTIFTQTYETSKLPKLNSARVLHPDFKDKMRGYNGVYVIQIASTEQKWVQQSKLLSVSDIGLIVKQEKDKIYVFANSIKEATAMSGVKVSFVSSNNQQLYTATTNSDGVATFDITQHSPGFYLGMVTAQKGEDFTFVWLDQSKIETSRFDVGGREPNAAGLNAMIYAERNLYRPGETIHVSAIVRDEQWNNPGELPVKLRLTMPNGKEFATMRKILTDEGACETIFKLPPTALTGTYDLDVLTGNDVLLNSYDISVEKFVPDRIKLALHTDKTEYKIGESVHAIMKADNLFGTPAAGRKWEAELNLEKVTFNAKDYPDYSFAASNELNFQGVVVNGTTDNKGAAIAAFFMNQQQLPDVGQVKGNIMATVFDETGRPVHRYAHFDLYTRQTFIGIKNFDAYTATRKPLKIDLVAVNKEGVAQNGVSASVAVIKKEWHTVIQQDGNRYKYVSQQEQKVVLQRVVDINSNNTSFYFTPQLSGEYEVRIALPGSDAYVSQTFYAWGGGDTQYTSFEVNNEGNVTIKADKDKYKTGDKINLLFTAPFDGRMLVTLERDKVMKYYYVNVKNKAASLTVNADEAGVPNMYIAATLFRPMDGSDMPLTVAHGYMPINIENTGTHMPVKITMAAVSRSKTKQTITVKTAPGANVTIAAVDEGILQVKDYQAPDPYKYFYQKTALSVTSYDIYPLLLPEIRLGKMSTGGDEADAAKEANQRVNPTFVNRVKLTSFWSGILHADASGIVRYTIDVPQFSGDIHAMVVAYKGKAMGSAEQHMKVADPVVISTSLPRFLSPKDAVIMPVTLSNTTNNNATATVTVQLSNGLSVSGGSTQTVTLPAHREGRAVFDVVAGQAIGANKVTVTVKAMGETFTDETEIGIRPPASLQKITGSGVANENATTAIGLKNGFIPSTFHGKLIVGRSPMVQFTNNLSYLVNYPYGCLEQTVATAFPQLYYQDLVKSITGQSSSDENPAYNVQQAIYKLQGMQLSDGALSYWPDAGAGGASWWGTIFAAHFMIEAQKAGYEVNANTLKRMLDYMKTRLGRRETEIYVYNGNMRKEIAAHEIAYSLYVLALAGQPQPSTMNFYKGHPEMLAMGSKYLLASAYALAGQQAQIRQVLPGSFTGEQASTSLGGSFYSYIRDEALALNALLDIDPNNQQVGIMARQLSQQMKSSPYLNTEENSFGLLALGKIARYTNRTTASAAVFANGKTVAANKNGENLDIDLKNYSNQTIQVQVKGKGPNYYFWQMAGISTDGSYKQEDSYMKVRRTYLDRTGKAITDNSFHQNDLIIVKISVQAQYNGVIQNVAITDMLPAGFEIENTRLTEMPDMAWIKDAATPDYLDLRDDRVNLFTDVQTSVKNFYYMVRAVSPGVYQLGPVQADAMYDGAYHSYNGAGVVKVMQ